MFDIHISAFSDFIQIVANIFTVITVVISVCIFLSQKKRELKNKAIKIGTEIEQIVLQWSYIDMVLNKSFPNVYKILATKDVKNMKLFERSEICKVFSKYEIKRINSIFIRNKFNSSYIGAPVLVYNVHNESVIEANKRFPKVIRDIVNSTEDENYTHIFHRVLIDTLNRMETLCTMIELKVADEYTVFTLTGDRFFEFTKIMYYYISQTNYSSSIGEKKLVHLISLFNKWKKKIESRKAKEHHRVP